MIIILTSIIFSLQINSSKTLINKVDFEINDLTSSEPILITSDQNFTDYGFEGDGTLSNPYKIANLSIVVFGKYGYVPIEIAISIRDTTAHFTINNCNLSAEFGISFYNIKENTAIIENNFFYNCSRIINISSSNGVIVRNNLCPDIGYINLYRSELCVITENNVPGVHLEESNSNNVTHNLFSNSGITLFIYGLYDVDKIYFENNTLKGEEILVYSNKENIHVNNRNSSQVILINCFNSSIYDLNLTNLSLKMYFCNNATVYNNTSGRLHLSNSDYCFIQNNTEFRLYSIYSDYCRIEFNTGSIELQACYNSKICSNDFSNHSAGIQLISCHYSNVEGNICNSGNLGLYISSSPGTKITNNSFNSNINGIALSNARDLLFELNDCSNNSNYGFSIFYTNNCILRNNTIKNNSNYGIYMHYSNNNLIYHNIFIDNNIGGNSQAYEYGTNNTWYNQDSLTGNYWSNFDGEGSYLIWGNGSVDPYPLLYVEGYPIISEYKKPNTFTIVIFCCLFYLVAKKRKKNLLL